MSLTLGTGPPTMTNLPPNIPSLRGWRAPWQIRSDRWRETSRCDSETLPAEGCFVFCKRFGLQTLSSRKTKTPRFRGVLGTPRTGLEPVTCRLTAGRSTIELSGIKQAISSQISATSLQRMSSRRMCRLVAARRARRIGQTVTGTGRISANPRGSIMRAIAGFFRFKPATAACGR